MAKDKYEISLWEDILQKTEEISTRIPEDFRVDETPNHYEERKIAIIGSDSITVSCRAREPKMVSNINGTHTFTFKMFYVCKNDTVEDIIRQTVASDGTILKDADGLLISIHSIGFNGEEYPNPFLSYLVNERKVKVKWQNKWYDMVIKNCQEDTSGKSVTYTCTDLFINELSKTGFDIELDTELQNNVGTVTELADIVLENTDWTVDVENSDVIKQEKEEAVYETSFSYNNHLTLPTIYDDTTTTSIPFLNSGTSILLFYNQIQEICSNGESKSGSGIARDVTFGHDCIQFAYTDQPYEQDTNSMLVNNADCYSVDLDWKLSTASKNKYISLGIGDEISFSSILTLNYEEDLASQNYRANRLVRSQKSVLDPITSKYCNVYTALSTVSSYGFSEGDTIYGYTQIRYEDPTYVNNLIVNSKDFLNINGWSGDNLTFSLYPAFTSDSSSSWDSYDPTSYLLMNATTSSMTYYNNGLKMMSSFISDGFSCGEKYILRCKIKDGTTAAPGIYLSGNIGAGIEGTENGSTVPYFSMNMRSEGGITLFDNWVEWEATCIKSATREEIYDNNISIYISVYSGNIRWLEEAQFFRYVEDKNGTRINPGELDKIAIANTYYVYYNHSSVGTSSRDVKNFWESTTDFPDKEILLKPIYGTDRSEFEKIRSIQVKNSNCFNILQSLAETFGCWVEFIVEHESNGAISYDTVDNENKTINEGEKANQLYGTPKKYVRFKKDVGKEVGYGFIAGIDLKTIQRTIKSDQLVTKTIVSPNVSEFAPDGFCSIARSHENYPRINFIYNFDYYVNHNMIDAEELNNDLYSPSYMGYYYYLSIWNKRYDSGTLALANKKNELLKQESSRMVYEETKSAAENQIEELKGEIIELEYALQDPRERHYHTWDSAELNTFISDAFNNSNTEIISRVAAITSLQTAVTEYASMITSLASSITTLKNEIDGIESTQASLLKNIRSKHFQFNRKYSRFIQEGTWTGKDYVDDDLYYLDALNIAYTSSRPQITYNISVLRLSALEEFKHKIFELGDISYIQDTEFLGYTMVNGIRTPVREKVMISEVTSNFDEPEKDTFKVQNYKTQFEDLFKRIVSSVQSLQYASDKLLRNKNIV